MNVIWLLTGIWIFFPAFVRCQRRIIARYNFERQSHQNAFTVLGSSNISRSRTRFKDGSRALEWDWASGDKLILTLPSARQISSAQLRRAGVQLWIYNTQASPENLTVSLSGTVSGSQRNYSIFNISLSFQGWRAVWVSLRESKVCGVGGGASTCPTSVSEMTITAPTTQSATSTLYFDLITIVREVKKPTRDKVVPPINNQYGPGDYWQQSYRWSMQTPTVTSANAPNDTKLSDLVSIEERLDNWFVNQSESSVNFQGNIRERWISLRRNVDSANIAFTRLGIQKNPTSSVITGRALYGRNSLHAGKTFGAVMKNTLLPLALDYYVRSRSIEVQDVATYEQSNLNNATTRQRAITVSNYRSYGLLRIAGTDRSLRRNFTTALRGATTPYNLTTITNAINDLNKKRRERLLLLLEYIEDQGFTNGSGLGSLEFEMNRDGAGFMNSVYVLRKVLKDAGKLSNVIATMKWYNDFGEVYQQPFEYAGTTADRMRTISIFRLFTVLMMPNNTRQEKIDKIRDMEALVRWYTNALSINEGLAGVLKPDFLAFHHNGYYAPAYTPSALHVAALIEYLLGCSLFKLGPDTVENIHNALAVMRIVAVKYSTPNSVSGRFPGFTRAILATTFPAFAYHAASFYYGIRNHTSCSAIGSPLKVPAMGMFLRLYDTTEPTVQDYLEDGRVFTAMFYLNSIGSVNILENIKIAAQAMSIQAESSPQGFWAKNYGAFVIHRRQDWAVTMKGFNKFVWDFEASSNQNVYGLYQSYGALLVANSEASLDVFDINRGWDWTRHPGTTTIRMNLDQLKSQDRRYFQPKELAGGVMLIGGGNYANGVFGMDFERPAYRYPPGSLQLNIVFKFKKSVFFADHTIICLGSNITANHSAPNITQTTLFQNMMLNPQSSIYTGSTHRSLSTNLSITPGGNPPPPQTLMDANDDVEQTTTKFQTPPLIQSLYDLKHKGNGYFIPNPAAQGLYVSVSDQRSKLQDGSSQHTSARYATAWFNHGVDPSDEEYEYAILVNKSLNEIEDLARRQNTSNDKVYEVLKRDDEAHVVKINSSNPGQTQYGYVIFSRVNGLPGPVTKVLKPCIVMVESVNNSTLYISVSSPNLKLNFSNPATAGHHVDKDDSLYSVSQKVKIRLFVRDAVNVTPGDIRQNGRIIPHAEKAAHLYIKPMSRGASTGPRKGRQIQFKKLEKGFSTEVELTR